MTPIEVFEKVAKHLLEQGEQCTYDSDCDDGCAYRNSAGLQCAVGCLITDEQYVEDMEGVGVSELLDVFELPLLEPHVELLSELQDIHDGEDPEDWPEQLGKLRGRVDKGDFGDPS